MSDPKSIQLLLPSLGFSYAHLCRIFTAKFGISPVRYRNAVRLEKARNMLKNPLCTVAQAAYSAGFSDPAYFSRKFHEANGAAPSHSR
jgi:AraC-like DNA-binding protein